VTRAADDGEHARRAVSFGARAAEYARGRPGYPADALRHCLPAGARRVLDLGAGTGKLTSGLLALGLDVVAVEPLTTMRALLPPAATVLAGSAEAIPLPDAAVDAALVGQAFHWFERDAALAELARVLRPGGTLGLLWNAIDGREPWLAEISEIMRESSQAVDAEPPFAGVAGLTDPECGLFPHEQELDAEALVDNVASRSVVILMAPEERAELLARVRALAPPGRFRLPLVCAAWRSVRY
jgi:SAM-dependent methyltransferase